MKIEEDCQNQINFVARSVIQYRHVFLNYIKLVPIN